MLSILKGYGITENTFGLPDAALRDRLTKEVCFADPFFEFVRVRSYGDMVVVGA